LPIGERQTISQPFMVALMTQALELTGSERVLEIGTGSGYQAAVLAQLAARVCTVERVKTLADRARHTLDRLKLYHVVIKVFDGTFGWPEEAPFDAIIVTAGAPAVPKPLIDQLKENGRLMLVKRTGGVQTTPLTECAFVPLIGAHAWPVESSPPSLALPGGDRS
jgi:protein-L-isoaspartate(D-aspartate) O-methyltransferase